MSESALEHVMLTRRGLLKWSVLIGAAATGTPLVSVVGRPGLKAAAAAPKRRKVIFVTHDLNPFFIPVIHGFYEFGTLRNWEVQFVGPPSNDVPKTVELQAEALAAHPDAVAFTRIDTTSFDDNIRRAQQMGIFVILYNTASDGYKKLGLTYVGQGFVPAGRINGLQAAQYAHKITGRQEGIIVMGTIAPGHTALEQRMQGTTMGVNEYNSANGTRYVTKRLTTSTDEAEAISRISAEWTRDGDKIIGWAHADFGHWFTAIWAQDKGLKDRFANGGFDLVPGVLDAIKSGNAQWSIGQNPYAQGWVTSALIDMRLEAGYPPNDFDTGAEVVDASTITAVIEREKRFAQPPKK